MGNIEHSTSNAEHPITDGARAEWLKRKGYSPDPKHPLNLHNKLVQRLPSMTATEFVDTCIEQQWCPGYWREPLSPIEHLEISRNGLFFVGPGDRPRIDECMFTHA